MNYPVLALDLADPSFVADCPITSAVGLLASAGVEERGAIFTRREVVDFILDLVGYTADQPVHHLRLLEPSFGAGDFLLPALERLLEAWKAAGAPSPIEALRRSITAVELHRSSFIETRERMADRLIEAGISQIETETLLDQWLIYGDFLLVPLKGKYDIVIGNPPYVRQELIPDVLMAEYRLRYRTVFDRADLYIPFIERSLSSLIKGGKLGFICADRWMKNRYGGPLRQMVAEHFNLKIYIDMVDTPAFHSDVIAYPAITVIAREKEGVTRIAHRPKIERETLSILAQSLTADDASDYATIREMRGIVSGSEPWILESGDQLALVRRLENRFPALEDAGCKVGIGVATGADKAFIGKYDDLDVEEGRKLPLSMTRDIKDGSIAWRGYGVVNPFAESGKLVDLDEYPRLRRYLEDRKEAIAGRHVAKKAPANWYRTIDRIHPAIAGKPKLLIPDIKGEAHIVYEDEGLYPHHNLYFITSDTWDVRALQAVLLSGIARLFVAIYSTKMRGGYLRFQAQYLRRIRVPQWRDISKPMRAKLIAAAESQDLAACNQAVFEIYGLSEEERAALGGKGANA